MATSLVEIDSLSAIVIVDNELDPMSWIAPNTVDVTGHWMDLGLAQKEKHHDRGDATEIPMEALCCGAHGLSVLLTATKDSVSHSILFDTGPEESAWERNAKRLNIPLEKVEMIQLSHWHRDHSGGMLKAISLISSARKAFNHPPPIIDLHPNRPAYRGWQTHDKKVISLQADPKFEEIENSGGVVRKEEAVHAVLDDFFCVSGFIPSITDYETGLRGGMRWVEEKKEWVSDEEIADERFLMCNLKGKGLVLLTGCSHRGVVSACREALRLTNNKIPLHAILGGYHLAGSENKDNTKVELTVKDLKKLDPKVLLPGHCSGWRVKWEIEKSMPGRLVPCTVGSRYAF